MLDRQTENWPYRAERESRGGREGSLASLARQRSNNNNNNNTGPADQEDNSRANNNQ